MKFSFALFLVLFINPSIVADQRVITVASDQQQDDPSLRRDKECPDGFQGTNCAQNIDECQSLPYPCAGGNKLGSFCVDYDPPKKFKCGCVSGYDAILPNATDVTDNVTVEWRPLKCLPRDVCVGFLCHEDATCIVSSNNTAVCICNDELVGDGITSCSPAPTKVATRPPPMPKSLSCAVEADCNKLPTSVCVEGVCRCIAGYFRINGISNCLNENECADGYPNDCHKNAICQDTEGSYTCTCKDGYRDLNPNIKPGTICAQINECLDPSMNDCNIETHVCVDRRPPVKWECVERTPAPTPAPTPLSCVDDNDNRNGGVDTGCTINKRVCVADPGNGVNFCVVCLNDNEITGVTDTGCEDGSVCGEVDANGSFFPPLLFGEYCFFM